MKHYQQLTYEQRCQIYLVKQEGYNQQATGVSQATVSRELRRNKGKQATGLDRLKKSPVSAVVRL